MPLSSTVAERFVGAIHLSSASDVPRFVSQQDPWVPDDLMRKNAVASTELYVNEDGQVAGTNYLSGDRSLFQAAADAAALWRFEPLIRDGHRTKFVVRLTLTLTWSTSPLSANIRIRFGTL
jgi:hypothetical protein